MQSITVAEAAQKLPDLIDREFRNNKWLLSKWLLSRRASQLCQNKNISQHCSDCQSIITAIAN